MSMRSWTILLSLTFCLFGNISLSSASDHLDAPLASEDGRLDVNDLYAFQSPANPDNTVLIMTVNPFAGVASPTTFNTKAEYEFLIDNSGDAEPDVTYTATFFQSADPSQQDLLVSRNHSIYALGSTETDVATNVGGKIRAGLFDDPFFFDLAGFENGLNFTGEDAFAGANVSAIVLEVPSAELGGPNVGIWARTTFEGHQVDRAGRPAINTVLIPSPMKDAFNQGEPDHDPADFGDAVRASITGLSGDADYAATLTDILLPDVLTFDTSSSDGFLNGRQLADDVIDASLTLLTNSPSPIGDGVDANDVMFSDVFPYLAPAHAVIPEPTTIGLVVCSLAMAASTRRRACSVA